MRAWPHKNAGDLGEIGLDVWRDQRLSGGQEWWDTILQSIRSVDFFLFVVPARSTGGTVA